MSENFKELDFLPKYNLYYEYQTMLQKGILKNIVDHVCVTTIPDQPDNYLLGTGSLGKEWTNAKIKDIENPEFKEEDFTQLCSVFKGTLFEDVYNELTKHFKIGRLRIMHSKPKTCLSWHYDHHKRIHYSMQTNHGSMMVIEEESKHLPLNTWWLTDTTKYHTALNAGYHERCHLVGTVL